MVKKSMKKPIVESGNQPDVVNDSGKRPNDTENKDDKKRVKTWGLYRQPTVNELNRLQETETLFNSNLFRLQVEEVLEEVKVKEKTDKKIQQWFTTFSDHLNFISEDDTEYDLTEQTLAKKLKVKIPISSDLDKTKCVFKFHKFKNIDVVGSYAVGCAINSKLRIDIQITVPAETYTKNDSINYRYHKKRAAYLAYIASHLSKLDSIQSINYTWLKGNTTKPCLDITPVDKLAKHFTVRLNLVCEPEAYKLHRFSPKRNNLRESWIFNSQENSSEVGPPTPYYNSSILRDLTASENQEFVKNLLLKSENLKQAVVLLKIWLRQRNLDVSGYVVSLFVAYLVQSKRINNIMSSYQIVRNVWIAWKTTNWDTKGISLHKGEPSPPIEEFHEHFPIVFLDTTGYYNICYDMCKGTYDALKRESAIAVDMLDNMCINSFIPLFMVPVKPLLQFDHILTFKNLSALKEAIISKASKDTRVNYGVDQLALVTDTLHALLRKGLGSRVNLVLQIVDADFSWPVKKRPEKSKQGHEESLSFGLVLDQENATNIVEKGPPANLPEAEDFRLFWGDKSELRRFQDGSITEACVWDAESPAERRGICGQIVDYLLELKYGIPSSDLFHTGSQLDSLLFRKHCASNTEEASMEVTRAFDGLRRDLRSLDGLPLDVSAVYGVSPVFSYCDPLPPLPQTPVAKPWRRGNACLLKDGAKAPEYVPVARAVVELGYSGKWPSSLQAFRCLKAAFHLQLASRLSSQHQLPAQAYPAHLDVLKDGFVFRLEIAHPKEITLVRRETENGVVKFRESEESVRLQRDTVLLPRLRGALHGLHQKHPAFGPTACLVKRWLSSHLLSPPHIPSTVVDLLSAAVFLHPHPLRPASQPSTAFLRVLRLLAETDWSREMIVLDFNQDMKREEIIELERKFSEREDKTPCMYIVTSYDGDLPSVWSAICPTEHVLQRVKALAKSALGYFEGALLREMRDNVLGAFVPSLAGYDVIIHLREQLVPFAGERVDRPPSLSVTSQSTSSIGESDLVPPVEFHSVERYLQELRSAYGEFALFFHDCFGGQVIAMLWKPEINEQRDFQLTNCNALKPTKTNGVVSYNVNIPSLIEDFRILGAGLVSDVTVN